MQGMLVVALQLILLTLSCGLDDPIISIRSKPIRSSQDSKTQLTYFNFAKEVLDSACSPCHSPNSDTKVSIPFVTNRYEDDGEVLGIASAMNLLKIRIADETMPPADSVYKLNDHNREKLLEWLEAGAPMGTQDLSKAQVVFTKPVTQEELSHTKFQVKLQFLDVPDAATWNLYWSEEVTKHDSHLIQAGMPISQNEFEWNTSDIVNGKCFLHVVLNLGPNAKLFTAPGSVRVQHPQAGNNPPSVLVNSPNGSEVLISNNATKISYSASDPDTGDLEKLVYKIELSRDGGQNWQLLQDNYASTSYAWQISVDLPQGIQYLVRVKADDGKGGLASDTSDTAFAISEKEITYKNSITSILAPSCSTSACHDDGAIFSAFFVWNRYSIDVGPSMGKGAFDLRERILIRANNVAMPMPPLNSNFPVLSLPDKEKIQIWLWSGANE